jgi:hypothetical protein
LATASHSLPDGDWTASDTQSIAVRLVFAPVPPAPNNFRLYEAFSVKVVLSGSHSDRLRSYGAAMKVIGNMECQECRRWLNNRAENSHQPFRRRERAMANFRDIKTLQKFAAAHASIHNHFNKDRHLNHRETFKLNRSAALAEWHQLAA